LSILSGSHQALVPDVLRELNALGVDAPVIVGGIIPDDDRTSLLKTGVTAVYTPKDYAVAQIMSDIVDIVERHRADDIG
jgi:(2R)-ethylmalonyl-CoA mutase